MIEDLSALRSATPVAVKLDNKLLFVWSWV